MLGPHRAFKVETDKDPTTLRGKANRFSEPDDLNDFALAAFF
jgi:hypothetical protein